MSIFIVMLLPSADALKALWFPYHLIKCFSSWLQKNVITQPQAQINGSVHLWLFFRLSEHSKLFYFSNPSLQIHIHTLMVQIAMVQTISFSLHIQNITDQQWEQFGVQCITDRNLSMRLLTLGLNT